METAEKIRQHKGQKKREMTIEGNSENFLMNRIIINLSNDLSYSNGKYQD